MVDSTDLPPLFRGVLAGLILLILAAAPQMALYGAEDVVVCERTFRQAADRGWDRLPMDQVVVAVGRTFIGLPYKAHTLERPGDECLTVDFSGLDCTTFVESTLALARCIRLHQPTFEAFVRELTGIRYRDGRVDQYPSRLHYFSDWIYEGGRQGRVADVTAAIGGIPYPLTLSFMSTHSQAYPALRNPDFVSAMQTIERTISARTYHYVPKGAIGAASGRIKPGDGPDAARRARERILTAFPMERLREGILRVVEDALDG